MILSDTVHINYVSSGTKKEMYKWKQSCWGVGLEGISVFQTLIWFIVVFLNNNSY